MKMRNLGGMKGGIDALGGRLLAALLTAGLLWLAFPGGGGFWPLAFVALVPFFLSVMRSGTSRQAGWSGVLTGLFHFLVLLYWIVIVLGHYGGLPFWLSAPALVLLALYMSLYLGIFALIARLLLLRIPSALALWIIPAVWVALDWCRSFLFTGFPWMDMGSALGNVPWMVQTADLWGHYGLSYCLVLVNTLAALSFMSAGRKNGRFALAAPVLLLFSLVALYSFLRWQQVERNISGSETLRVGVVQGNIPQDLKWSRELQKETLVNYIGQSRRLIEQNHPMLVVWPETALPFYPVAHPLLQSVRDLAVAGSISLLTGAPWYEQVAGSGGGQVETSYYNSALLFDAGGQITDRYSKSHLVPYGEYVPMKKMLPFLAPLVEAVGDFSPGAIQGALACHNARIGVLICFESIFPDISRKWVDAKANVLVNLTNDAWYGRSSAPYHSLAMTILRAVETRRSLVRAANTGFSGFIDPLGRVRKVSPLFEPWAESAEVVLMDEETWFVRGGYLFAPFCLGMVMFFLIWIVLHNPRSRRFP